MLTVVGAVAVAFDICDVSVDRFTSSIDTMPV